MSARPSPSLQRQPPARQGAAAPTLADLARRVQALGPDHRNPELFREHKAEIVHELRKLARSTRQ